MKRSLLAVAGIASLLLAWHDSHQLNPRQSALASRMVELQNQRAELVRPREAGLQHLQSLAASAQPEVRSVFADLIADESARLAQDVQTSEDRWFAAQAEFAQITRHRQRWAWCFLGLGGVFLLLAVVPRPAPPQVPVIVPPAAARIMPPAKF